MRAVFLDAERREQRHRIFSHTMEIARINMHAVLGDLYTEI